MTQSVLLISCTDRPGLIHEITGVLLKFGANILENHEFVDREAKRFFMRTAIEGQVDAAGVLASLQKALPKDSTCEFRPSTRRRLLVFASKEAHCLGDLLVRHATGELSADILAVISQVDECGELVKRFDLPFHHVPVNGDTREGHERRVADVVAKYQADYLVFARYMRIMTPAFVAKFKDRIINIHHSFLPAFIGKDPYEQAYKRGVKIIGATSHFVTDGLDEGPIICQQVIAVDHSNDHVEMAKKGRDIERLTLALGLNLVLEDRVIIDGRRTIVFS